MHCFLAHFFHPTAPDLCMQICVRLHMRQNQRSILCMHTHCVCVWRQIEAETHRCHLSFLPDSASRPMFFRFRDLNYLPWSNRHGVFTVGLPPTYTQCHLAAIRGNFLFAVFMISIATSQLNLHHTDLREGELDTCDHEFG